MGVVPYIVPVALLDYPGLELAASGSGSPGEEADQNQETVTLPGLSMHNAPGTALVLDAFAHLKGKETTPDPPHHFVIVRLAAALRQGAGSRPSGSLLVDAGRVARTGLVQSTNDSELTLFRQVNDHVQTYPGPHGALLDRIMWSEGVS
jgi:hypothetical protein